MITKILFQVCDWADQSCGRFWIRDLVRIVPAVEHHFWSERSRMFDKAQEEAEALFRSLGLQDIRPSSAFVPHWYIPRGN